MYRRVIPRDLFNESKLLKCLGQLALIIHEVRDCPKGLSSYNSGLEFRIDQRKCCGGLYAANIQFKVKSFVLELYTNYNSKDPYPLICNTDEGECLVFEDDGTLTQEFVDYVARIQTPT